MFIVGLKCIVKLKLLLNVSFDYSKELTDKTLLLVFLLRRFAESIDETSVNNFLVITSLHEKIIVYLN
jgi:hypothetical protein